MTYENIIEIKKYREQELNRNIRKSMNHKYRIKSQFKLLTFITVTFAIIIFSALMVINADFAVADSQESYITYTVQSGDTLWSIAESNMDTDNDIRKSIYIIEENNNITSEDLIPGMELKIPVN